MANWLPLMDFINSYSTISYFKGKYDLLRSFHLIVYTDTHGAFPASGHSKVVIRISTNIH